MVLHPTLILLILLGIHQTTSGLNTRYDRRRKPTLYKSCLLNGCCSFRLDEQIYKSRPCSLQILHLKQQDDEEEYANDVSMGSQSNSLPTSTFGADAVPSGQLPANEYLNLITSPLFNWANEENGDWGLALRLGITYLFFYWLICFPISSATFIQEDYWLHRISASNVGALGVIFILLIRLYSGWGYVGSRLTSKVIEYEKTGW